MAEGLMTAEGEAIAVDADQVDREFAASMAASDGPSNDPPKRPERPQTGEHSSPPRRGRPPKAERSRVADAKAGPAKPNPQLDAQRSDGVKGLVQLGAGLCLLMDSRTADEDIAWRADAVTLATSAEAIATAVVETAKHNSSFAAAVDKVTSAGPWAAIISVTLGVSAQIARNHGVKMGEALGAKPPEQVLAELEPEPENG